MPTVTKWTAAETKIVNTALELNADLAAETLAEIIAPLLPAHTKDEIARKCRRGRNPDPKRKGPERIPASTKPQYAQEVHLEGDLLCMGDQQAPFHDADFMEKVIDIALAWKISQVAVCGDLLDMGYFSKYPKHPADVLEEELEAAEQILASLSGRFARVVYIMGNHEQRMIVKAMNFQMPMRRWRKLINEDPNVTVTEQVVFTLQTKDPIPYVIGHPDEFSVIAGNVPTRIGMTTWPDHHVVTFHEHNVFLGRMRDGKRWSIAGGMCADPKRLLYAQGFNSRPRMAQGSVLIKEGHPYLLTAHSDFEALKRMYP